MTNSTGSTSLGGFSRRRFLVGGAAVTALGAFGAPAPAARAARSARDGERVLVVVQLTGGNDGLATVVPLEQDAWYRARPTLSAVAKGSHELGDGLALHPALGGLARLTGEGLCTCVHGVGTPVPDRSHFRSMEVWHTADARTRTTGARPTGWLARLGEQVVARGGGTPAALHVGGGALPLSLVGRDGPAPSVEDLDQLRLDLDPGVLELLGALYAEGGVDEAGFLRRAARDALDLGRRLEEGAAAPLRADWPQDPFARDLALVARLVRSGLGARLYQVELDGFDTHRDQAVQHAALLARLDGGLVAFQRELEAAGLGDRVLTFVFSEFGRRAAENASRGTDHGAGGPAFLLGSGGRGGGVGSPPDLERLVDGDVPTTLDFRAVYTALERDWMGLEPSTDVPAAPVLRRVGAAAR